MNKAKNKIYIIDYTDGTHTVYGPYTSVSVLAIHVSIPKIVQDTITFHVSDGNESKNLTVSMVHEITSNPDYKED